MTAQQQLQHRLDLETKIIDFIQSHWNVESIRTQQSKFCPVDFFMTKDKQVRAICEVRTRADRYEDVQKWGGMFLNYRKLSKALDMSQHLQLPFLFIAYFMQDNLLVYWKITDDSGLIQVDMILTSRSAQDNIEGGNDKKRVRNLVMIKTEPILIKKVRF